MLPGCDVLGTWPSTLDLEVSWDEAQNKVREGGITFRVRQRLNADEPSSKAFKNIGLPADTDPSQWTEPVDDRCGPAALPDERKRVVIVRVSHGFRRRNV
jgi:hypothetical protein